MHVTIAQESQHGKKHALKASMQGCGNTRCTDQGRVGFEPDVVTDGIGQLGIKGLQQIQDSVHKEQCVVVTIQHPLVGFSHGLQEQRTCLLQDPE